MKNRLSLIRGAGALSSLLLAFAAPAFSQGASVQTLDRVYSYDTTSVLLMATGNVHPQAPIYPLGYVSGSAFITCTFAVVGGLYCLDGNKVLNWANPLEAGSPTEPVKCDLTLGIDPKKGESCTAMTVDQNGAIWLAAKKHNAHSLFKVEKGLSCPATSPPYTCFPISAGRAWEIYGGRPPIVDLVPVDGDIATNFKPCSTCGKGSGVLGIEERKNAVFFRDPFFPSSSPPAQAVQVVGSKEWGLQGKELLQDITLLQLPVANSLETTILATTTNGRILAKNTSYSDWARVITLAVPNPPSNCASGTQQYGIRASTTSGIVYLSDRCNYKVLSLKPNANFSVLDEKFPPLSTESHPVVGLTIAPGNIVNLSDDNCKTSTGCPIINGPDGVEPALSFKNLQLLSNESGATVFQIKGIPDCRYAQSFSGPTAIAKRTVCATPPAAKTYTVIDPNGIGVFVRADGSLRNVDNTADSIYPPSALSLNVRPLLPQVVVNSFIASRLPDSVVLPDLLISPQYRAQPTKDYLFEGIFAVAQRGVQFANTFEGEFEVPLLDGTTTGNNYCKYVNEISNAHSPNVWYIATYVSELYKTKATGAYNYVDTLANVGCASIRGGLQGMSLVTYNLQVNPNTYGPTAFSPFTTRETPNNDAVYARMLQSLYRDLNDVQVNFACVSRDGGAVPIKTQTCNSLTSTWNNGKAKLDKCIEAAFQPKSSAGSENCQSWVSQLTNYRNSLPATTDSMDKGNRVGELKKRIQVLFHVYYDRFVPSIPNAGFCREKDPIPSNCPDPWPTP